MTKIAYPTTRLFAIAEFTPTLDRNITHTSRPKFSRRRKELEYPGALWGGTLVYPPSHHDERAVLEAFWNVVSAANNTVALWHFARPTPRGTLQTNTTASASAEEGASTISINADTGKTLLIGDMFSVALAAGGAQLVQVSADVTSVSSVMSSVAFVPALVGDVNSGAAVTVIRPTTPFKIEGNHVPMTYVPGHAQGFAVTLVEAPEW